MAKIEAGGQATGATGRFASCLSRVVVLVYLHLVTPRQQRSDDTNSEDPSSPPVAQSQSVAIQVLDLQPAPSDVSRPSPPAAAQDDGGNHPIIGIMRDQELGKATLAYTIPITMGLLASGKGKLTPPEMTLILIALSVGCAAIWNGILLRNTFAKAAQVEMLGIILVFLSFKGLIALLLPVEFRWVPAVCMGLFLLPFVMAARAKELVSCGIFLGFMRQSPGDFHF